MLVISSFIVLNCTNMNTQKQDNTSTSFDKKLIGTWESKQIINNNPNMGKSRKITRKEDGTFVENRTLSVQGRSQRINTNGHWWTKDNQYFEQITNSEDILIFNYKSLDSKKVSFTLVNYQAEDASHDYIETKSE